MKTWAEITEKIDELMEKQRELYANHEDWEREKVCNQIDALLWVIGDESGKPI